MFIITLVVSPPRGVEVYINISSFKTEYVLNYICLHYAIWKSEIVTSLQSSIFTQLIFFTQVSEFGPGFFCPLKYDMTTFHAVYAFETIEIFGFKPAVTPLKQLYVLVSCILVL